MRLSVDRDDPGFAAWCELRDNGKNIRVFLNGVERDKVVLADEGERFIVRIKTDERGEYMMNSAKDEFVHETLTGDVHIEVYDEKAAA